MKLMFWLRDDFLWKKKNKSESRKAQFNKHMIYFPVTENHGDNAWRNSKVFTNLHKEEQTRHVFNKRITLLNMFFDVAYFPKYRKLHIIFFFLFSDSETPKW